jgi:hypothetical protein
MAGCHACIRLRMPLLLFYVILQLAMASVPVDALSPIPSAALMCQLTL